MTDTKKATKVKRNKIIQPPAPTPTATPTPTPAPTKEQALKQAAVTLFVATTRNGATPPKGQGTVVYNYLLAAKVPVSLPDLVAGLTRSGLYKTKAADVAGNIKLELRNLTKKGLVVGQEAPGPTVA